MNNNSYNILVHVVNLILLGFIYFLCVLTSIVSTPADDPGVKVFQYFSIGFMFVLWAVNYWLQYKAKKKKWYLPFVGTVLYFAIVLSVLGYVFPYIVELLIK